MDIRIYLFYFFGWLLPALSFLTFRLILHTAGESSNTVVIEPYIFAPDADSLEEEEVLPIQGTIQVLHR